MRFVVVGLGSMGKRRIRNLFALGHGDIAGVDPRSDRREDAASTFAIRVYRGLDEAIDAHRPDALIISTPPDRHMDVAFVGLERRLPCFIEASVVDAERIHELNIRALSTGILFAPSCTMRYFSGPQKVRECIRVGVIGRPLSFTYQSGQYLPDWHPWEPIAEYYVSNPATGGAREIVPFELTWLTDVFGLPEALACVRGKVTDLPADIDDLYHCLLRFPGNVLGNLTVEVISRPHPTREMRVLGSDGELVYSADANVVRYARAGVPGWAEYALGGGTVERGYINPEEPYVAEMRDFLTALEQRDARLYPNTLRADYDVLQLLYRLEALSERSP